MLDKFTIREILGFLVFFNIIGLAGLYACIRALYIGLKDHAAIYKAINGDK